MIKDDDIIQEPPSKRRKMNGQQQMRVMVVEDDTINQKIILKMLEATRLYIVDITDNGQKGVDLFISMRNQGIEYHAILMVFILQTCYFMPEINIFQDSEMPVMNGQEATRRIRKYEEKNNLKRTKIIGVSANSQQTFRDQAINNGMDMYITKPYKRLDILEALNFDDGDV